MQVFFPAWKLENQMAWIELDEAVQAASVNSLSIRGSFYVWGDSLKAQVEVRLQTERTAFLKKCRRWKNRCL
jgi:hypothetical protein